MPGTQRHLREERLEARLSKSAKDVCMRAAAIQGRTLTDFVVQSAVEAAQRTVREHEFMALTRRDRIAFVEALLHPAVPNARLRKAAKWHSRVFAK